jgi:hypothetical protein
MRPPPFASAVRGPQTRLPKWRGASPDVLQAIWAQLPARRAQLGIRIHRLGWAQADIQAFVANTLKCSGTWVIGVYGAVAEFSTAPEEPAEISVDRESIVACSQRGRYAASWRALPDRQRCRRRPQQVVVKSRIVDTTLGELICSS